MTLPIVYAIAIPIFGVASAWLFWMMRRAAEGYEERLVLRLAVGAGVSGPLAAAALICSSTRSASSAGSSQASRSQPRSFFDHPWLRRLRAAVADLGGQQHRESVLCKSSPPAASPASESLPPMPSGGPLL